MGVYLSGTILTSLYHINSSQIPHTQEMTDDLLPSVLPSIVQGLQDVDDDVRAVAAASLNPVADSLIKVCKHKVS